VIDSEDLVLFLLERRFLVDSILGFRIGGADRGVVRTWEELSADASAGVFMSF
jgi:hypothetical protein